MSPVITYLPSYWSRQPSYSMVILSSLTILSTIALYFCPNKAMTLFGRSSSILTPSEILFLSEKSDHFRAYSLVLSLRIFFYFWYCILVFWRCPLAKWQLLDEGSAKVDCYLHWETSGIWAKGLSRFMICYIYIELFLDIFDNLEDLLGRRSVVRERGGSFLADSGSGQHLRRIDETSRFC